MGAHVTVVEREPLSLLEAHLEGFCTSTLEDSVSASHMIVTVTGYDNILQREHFDAMRSGVITANAGHFASEIDIPALEDMAASSREVRGDVTEYVYRMTGKYFCSLTATLSTSQRAMETQSR
jgi:adenosylhomocysteinase